MKRALVCGAGGFIGGHLVTYLKQQRYWVRGVDIKHHEYKKTNADEFEIIDLRRWDNRLQATRAMDEICALAANMGEMGLIHTPTISYDLLLSGQLNPGKEAKPNARQTIEAGIKEGKGTFAMRYLKVRSKPALYLQEQFGRFAANFVRFAAEWVAQQCPQVPSGWEHPAQPKVKQQVKVGAHTSAWVTWQKKGCLVRFTDHSVFAGRSLQVSKPVAIQLALPFSQKVQT
jgi:hypothetical protein